MTQMSSAPFFVSYFAKTRRRPSGESRGALRPSSLLRSDPFESLDALQDIELVMRAGRIVIDSAPPEPKSPR
jgi:hypothetical protein